MGDDLWWEWPQREVAFGVRGLIREVTFGLPLAGVDLYEGNYSIPVHTKTSILGGLTNTYLAFRLVFFIFLTPLTSKSRTQILPVFCISSTAFLL
jgi:hypothetical protein